MTIRESVAMLTGNLSTVYSHTEAANIAALVVEHVTRLSRREVIVNKDRALGDEQENKIQHVLEELLTHRPVQYVLGEVWFMGMKFYVDEKVLIPRPETEELVDLIKSELSSRGTGPKTILDIGTGSG